MKEFKLQDFLKNPNRRIIDHDGEEVSILSTERPDKYNIVVMTKSGNVYTVDENGKHSDKYGDRMNLYFAPTVITRWMNIYPNYAFGTMELRNSPLYESKEIALKVANADCIATVAVNFKL